MFLRSKLFSFRDDPFRRGLAVQDNEQEVTKVCQLLGKKRKKAENVPVVVLPHKPG